MLQALQEPHVNLCQLLNTLYGVALLQGLSNSEYTQVGRVSQFLVQVVELSVVVAHKSVHALSDHTQTLLNHLLERAADAHNLTNRLHRRANLTAHASKLRQVPARNLTYHIIQLWSHVCARCCAHLANLVESVAQSYLSSHEGEGIAGSL